MERDPLSGAEEELKKESIEKAAESNTGTNGKKISSDVQSIVEGIRARENKKSNKAKLMEITERLTNRDAYKKADEFLKNYEKEIDMCGIAEADYRKLIKKMFTPHKNDEQDAAYLLMKEYGEDAIVKVADNLRSIALKVGDSAFAAACVTLLRVTNRAEQAATDRELYGIIKKR